MTQWELFSTDFKATTALEGVAAQDFAGDGQHHDSEVKPDRPVLDVGKVASDPVFYLLEGLGFPAPAVHLGPSCDPRLDPVTERIVCDHVGEQLVRRLGVGRMWTRPDKGHVALHDIEYLRQLVEA